VEVGLELDLNNLEQVQWAKDLAAGPLGQMMSRFPLRYASGIYIGPTNTLSLIKPNSATATLLRFGDRPFAVTCSHVLENFRKRPPSTEPGFWIGSLEIDPISRLVDEDRDLDLAVLDLSGLNLSSIHSGGEIGSTFVQPPTWPPIPPQVGDPVAFGGFPGSLRDHPRMDEVTFRSFSVGACEVTVSESDYLVCQLEREFWIGTPEWLEFRDWGGLSGGPVFMWRGLVPELIGIVCEYQPSLDLLRIRCSNVIRTDGTLRR
jgi:hypothetical protein